MAALRGFRCNPRRTGPTRGKLSMATTGRFSFDRNRHRLNRRLPPPLPKTSMRVRHRRRWKVFAVPTPPSFAAPLADPALPVNPSCRPFRRRKTMTHRTNKGHCGRLLFLVSSPFKQRLRHKPLRRQTTLKTHPPHFADCATGWRPHHSLAAPGHSPFSGTFLTLPTKGTMNALPHW